MSDPCGFINVLLAAIASVLGVVAAYLQHRNGALESRARELENWHKYYDGGTVKVSILQPVVLLGPAGVGKSSLMALWHAPWDRTAPAKTPDVRYADIRICQLSTCRKPHPLNSSLTQVVDRDLWLRIIDVPGDEDRKDAAVAFLKSETARFSRNAGQPVPGVCLVCMVDARDIQGGAPSSKAYYNAKLFGEIRAAVWGMKVRVSTIVIAHNKIDGCTNAAASTDADGELMRSLSSGVEWLTVELTHCFGVQACNIATMFRRDSKPEATRGSDYLKGLVSEAAIKHLATGKIPPFGARYRAES